MIYPFFDLDKAMQKLFTDVNQVEHGDLWQEQVAEAALDNIDGLTGLVEACGETTECLIKRYIIPPLQMYATQNRSEFEVYYNNNNPRIQLCIPRWKGVIQIKAETESEHQGVWENLSIGITYKTAIFEDECMLSGMMGKIDAVKLDCLEGEASEDWPHGCMPLPWSNWNTPEAFKAIMSGEVAEWIKGKVEEIKKEVKDKKINMYTTLSDFYVFNYDELWQERDGYNRAKAILGNMDGFTALIEARKEITERLVKRYIFAPLQAYARQKGGDSLYSSTAKNPNIRLFVPHWRGRIQIEAEDKPEHQGVWENLFIGVTYKTDIPAGNNPVEGEIDAVKLDCLEGDASEDWPHGRMPLPWADWSTPEAFEAIKSGEVVEWIKGKVKEIKKEMEDKIIKV